MSSIISPGKGPRKATLRPGEAAIVGFLGAMALVAATHPDRLPLSVAASLATVAVLFTVAALALAEQSEGWRYWARELLPVPVIPFIFLNIGRLVPLVHDRIFDARLEALDRALLGHEVQTALYNVSLPAWLADVLTLAYSTFFFMPLLLLIALARKRDPHLPQVVAAVVFTFLVSYTGYFVVPAYGPRATVAQERYATLPAGLVGAPLRDLLDNWEKTKTDAFPSGHTMVTLAVLFCASRRRRKLYDAILPVGALLIAATVLLTYHYVVDVLAAVPLVVVALLLAARAAGPIPTAEPTS